MGTPSFRMSVGRYAFSSVPDGLVVRTSARDLAGLFERSAEEIAHWRDGGGQVFLDDTETSSSRRQSSSSRR